MAKNKLLGRLGVWLCDRFTPRNLTKVEAAANRQYVELMIQSLQGNIPHYGRDRGEFDTPIVAKRVDYGNVYSGGMHNA